MPPEGLTLRAGQWLTGLGAHTELVLRGQVTLASHSTVSDLSCRLVGGYANQGYGFRGNSVQGVTFRDVVLDGSVLEQSYSKNLDNGQIGIAVYDSDGTEVLDCVIKNFSKDCVYVSRSKNTTVKNCTLQNFSRGGVVSVQCEGLDVEGCLFQDGYDLPIVIGNNGIWLEPNEVSASFLDVVIRGNIFKNLRRGIIVSSFVPTHILEASNTYRNCRHNGALFIGATTLTSHSSKFVGCGVQSAGDGPVGAQSALAILDSPRADVSRHSFYQCSGYRATVEVATGCRGASVTDCVFIEDVRRGIHAQEVAGGASGRRFARNRFMAGSTGGTFPAIHLEGTAQDPIGADSVEMNEIDTSAYSSAVTQTNVSGGRIGPNYNIATAATL